MLLVLLSKKTFMASKNLSKIEIKMILHWLCQRVAKIIKGFQKLLQKCFQNIHLCFNVSKMKAYATSVKVLICQELLY